MEYLKDLNILLSGQLLVGRTETLEFYLKDKVNALAMVGIDNIFSPQRQASFKLYKNGEIKKIIRLPSIGVKKNNIFSKIYVIISFLLHLFSIFLLGMFSSVRYDIFIGVGSLPSLCGVILRKFKKTKRCIYYCIDYFPPQKGISFNGVILKIYSFIDLICVKYSDITWHISPLIPDARNRFTGFKEKKANSITVPLCFNSHFLHFRPFEEIERYTLAFLGTSGYFHGLDLLFDSLPDIIKVIPEIKIKIIGVGPWNEFEKKIQQANMGQYFVIKGFIEKEKDLIEELSKCAAGIALYIPVEENPTLYADPGKPKLYAFCALPLIITKTPFVAKEISERKAGIVIDYKKEDLSKAVIEMLKNEVAYKAFRRNAFEFANSYTCEKIYAKAFKETNNYISL